MHFIIGPIMAWKQWEPWICLGSRGEFGVPKRAGIKKAMKQIQQYVVGKRIVPNETIPARPFACFAGVRPEVGAVMNKTFGTGKNPPTICLLYRCSPHCMFPG